MKYHTRNRARGYASLIAVITISIFMMTMMLLAYKRAVTSQDAQTDVQLKIDYEEKEEAVLRSIVSLLPNYAIKCMQDGSNANTSSRNALLFRAMFNEAMANANVSDAVSDDVLASLGITNSFSANSGDTASLRSSVIFNPIPGYTRHVTGGVNKNLGDKYPPALNAGYNARVDDWRPIISYEKQYGANAEGRVGLSTSDYPDFNIIPYPNINFGYTKPGEDFVAKQNWWAFRMDIADEDNDLTGLSVTDRIFVLSLYEIPSQLPISASSFMALGTHENGEAWQNVTIEGNVFAGRAIIEGDTALPDGLSTRRGAEMSANSTVAGQTFSSNPFTPGFRETYRLTEGDFFPVSLASESGRAAFVSINRSSDFFDRFSHITETQTVSPTTWNDYSVGALQCAMTLDISQSKGGGDDTPTELKFSYMNGGVQTTILVPLSTGSAADLPPGYTVSVGENEKATFDTAVDVAYGADGQFFFKENVSGEITFNNSTFGDPIVGTFKYGYYRTLSPFGVKSLSSGKICVAVYPERFAAFLASLGADGLDVNNSIAVNVDYPGSSNLEKPNIPCTENDYGVILQECSDLSAFSKGFSLVTNMRLYIGDDFNVVPATTTPVEYTPSTGKTYYPPCSLFSPEKRYGVDYNPFAVEFSGQVGSVADEDSDTPVRPLDATNVSGNSLDASDITVNLSPIEHPAELPPIIMMNWLITVEELKDEFD
ncbi:MAG: hypothetical protein ACSHX7_03160 [Luteolibacter sp.]